MKEKLSESAIVKALAAQVFQRITRKVIRDLQRMPSALSGEHSGLTNLWDEICVQIQYEESFAWDVYDESVRVFVDAYVDELPPHELAAAWLHTEEGEEWSWEDEGERDADPVFKRDVVEHITQNCVYAEADRWSNPRIRAYIERITMTD